MTIEFLRQFRIGPYAVFDFAASFLGTLLLVPVLTRIMSKLGFVVPLRSWILFTIPLSVLVHVLVNISTPLTQEFIRTDGGIIVKVVVIALFVWGMMFVSRKKT